MKHTTLTQRSSLASFAERVRERRVGPCRLLMLRTPVRSVVTFRGSFMSFPDFEKDDDLIQNVAVSLLDKGTKHRDRFAVAEWLEDRGAEVDFSSDGLYVDISGKALKEDASEVLALIAEQLREPLLDEEEFEKAKSRIGASIQRSMENTAAQASGMLTRHLYPRTHPNYTPPPDHRLERLMQMDVEDVRSYHARHFGSTAFTMVIVGDVDADAVEDSLRKNFEGWEKHDAAPRFMPMVETWEAGRSAVSILEKQNVDVRMGHPLRLRRDDPDYIPLYLTNYVLGGNFSARLMQTIRDEMGLTYGIRSGLYGITTEYDGHWQVAVTLSEENVERGIEETVRVVRDFAEGGVTVDELDDKKTTIVGSFTVGLATTTGLAASLLKNAERGFDVDYLDRFPELVESVTIERANDIVAKYLDPSRMHVAMAGTVPSSMPPSTRH